MKRIRLIISVLFCTFVLFSCSDVKKKYYTPEQYVNHTHVSEDFYLRDSIVIVELLMKDLYKRVDFFGNGAYYEFTQILIDTILYSPDTNKMAVLVVVKNPTSRQLMPSENHEWYYDATLYLAERTHDSMAISWVGPSFSNSTDLNELSDRIRDDCFNGYANDDTSNVRTYNINDRRFWSSSIWEELQAKHLRRLSLEVEKEQHPENVYFPKR